MERATDNTAVTDTDLGLSAPTYAAAFQCIGASCEDHCCGEWDIPVDKTTYGKYLQFPKDRLGAEVAQYVSISLPNGNDGTYAQINRGPSGCCPFLSAERLCGIQREYGSGLLAAACSIYPRSLSWVGDNLEGALNVSCPEAARNILLNPDFARVQGNMFSGVFRTDNDFFLAGEESGYGGKRRGPYPAIRAAMIERVRDRSRPLWERLLTIGVLCERLSGMDGAQGDSAVIGYLEDFRSGVGVSGLEAMPSDVRVRLDVVFGLTDLRIRDGCGARFQDTFWSFVEGTGEPVDGVAEDDVARFLHAEDRYHRPFFERYPFILENYLVNYMFLNLFPYGRAGSDHFIARSIFEEYVLMTAQFAWVNALLVGVAGRYRESFGVEHVVKTVQALTREVGHYPDALQFINDYLQARGLDSVRGMAILLKS